MSRWSAMQLAYCSNVHPGICPKEIETNLREITSVVRQQRQLSRMQTGLWINQDAALAYQSPQALESLQRCLKEQQLDVVTLNGFPQGNFHESVVKHKVYQPSWAEKSRLNFTISIANILAQCMPDDQSVGTISTLPLGYRIGWDGNLQHVACRNLCQFAVAMSQLEDNTGKHIRLCLEMEPGCVLERTEQVIELFTNDLPRAARAECVDHHLIDRYLGVCYDICHQAVMQESVEESMGSLHDEGIVVGKIQVSSALQIDKPSDPVVRARLLDFAEPKYLHQITTCDAQRSLIFRDDLLEALSDKNFPDDSTWWIHFHIPIQINTLDTEGISTTRYRIEQLCDYLASSLPYTPHLEVETYTWNVLPAGSWEQRNTGELLNNNVVTNNSGLMVNSLKHQELIGGIVNELSWLEQALEKRKLLLTE